MAKKKKKLQPITNLELIKSVRKPITKAGQTFKTKKDVLHRKRKHKGKDDD